MYSRDEVFFIAVCGGRDYGDREFMYRTLDAYLFLYGPDLLIVHGAARGADLMSEDWAKSREQLYFGVPAQWLKDPTKKRAGWKRNAEIIAITRPQLVIAFRGGRGTRNMIGIASDQEIEVHTPGWNLGD